MRPPIRAIARSTPFHVTRPPAYRTSTPRAALSRPPPSAASCSRWFSCSHRECQPSSSSDFFSSTTSPIRIDGTPTTPDEVQTPEAIPHPHSSRLPLPPSLPYSPDSIPFKRHLEALHQSLSSTLEESWTVYQLLHPSLRRYIPNPTYIALISHQLGAEDGDAWTRVSELLSFAEECGMKLEETGEKLLQQALRRAASWASRQAGVREHLEIGPARRLWEACVRLHLGDVSGVSVETRQSWLELLYHSTRMSSNPTTRRKIHAEAFKHLRECIAVDEAETHAEMAGRLVSLRIPPEDDAVEARLDRVRQLVFLYSNAIDVDYTHGLRVMGDARRSILRHQPDSNWKITLASVIKEASRDESVGPYHLEAEAGMDDLISWIGMRNQYVGMDKVAIKRLHRAQAAAANPHASTSAIILRAIRLTKVFHWDNGNARKGKRPDRIRLDPMIAINVLLSLFERVAHRALADVHVMVALITKKLLDYSVADRPETPAMAIRFTKALLSADLFGHIDSHLTHLIFDTLVNVIPRSQAAFALARRVYVFARSAETPYVWQQSIGSRKRWKILFQNSTHRLHGQIHFASQLYADHLVDCQFVPPTAMLRFIRALGSTGGLSKYVLLERHLKDYLYFEYQSMDNFVSALVRGLTARGQGRGAWLGFHLSLRIMGSKPLPQEVFNRVIWCLSRTQRVKDFRLSFGVLEYLDHADPLLPRLYGKMFENLLHSGISSKRYNDSEAQAVAIAVDIARHMQMRKLELSPRMMENFLRILIGGDYIDQAFKAIETIIRDQQQDPEKRKILGGVMVALARKGYFGKATDVFERYYKAHPAEHGVDSVLDDAQSKVFALRWENFSDRRFEPVFEDPPMVEGSLALDGEKHGRG